MDPFKRARITLTLWYCLILIFFLAIFSAAFYTAENRDIDRILIQRDFDQGTPPPVGLVVIRREVIHTQALELRRNLLIDLLVIDGLLLLAGGFLSYFLANKTLQPIQNIMDQQKQFIADASHELRTPLTAIISSSEVALRSKNRSTAHLRGSLEQIHQVGTRMGKIVESLLMLSRIELGAVKVEAKEVDLNEVLLSTISEMHSLIDQKGLKLNKNLEPTLVKGDKERLKQLVLILLDNAIKYTPKGGEVTVNLIKAPKPTLEISDTGVGISKEDQKHIFERFYRAEKSRTTAGAGLGLSIARWIAHEHHASVQVESEPGKGSTFRIVFSGSSLR